MKAIAACVICVTLGGCAVAAKMEARQDYQASANQYKACLAANPAAPQNCEGLRLAMETDERKFNNMGAAIDGSQSSRNLTILAR